MANTSEIETGNPLTEMLRFRCPPEMKKTIGYWAVDDNSSEQAILLRLLSDAIDREEKRRKKSA